MSSSLAEYQVRYIYDLPYQQSNLYLFYKNMRDEDLMELRELLPRISNGIQFYDHIVQNSIHARCLYTDKGDRGIVAIWGVEPDRSCITGQCWMLLSKYFSTSIRCKRILLSIFKSQLEFYVKLYGLAIVKNLVHKDNTLHINIIKKLGFTVNKEKSLRNSNFFSFYKFTR